VKKCLKFIKEKKLIVCIADKNVGTVLIEDKIYYDLCFKHLNDCNTYKKIEFNPQLRLYNECFNSVTELNKNGHLSNALTKVILKHIENKKLANFKVLPKLHKKEKFDTRPLINSSNTTTTVISKIIDFFLYPIVKNHYTYIKDSTNLIQNVQELKFDENCKLSSSDFSSLYTNIPILNGIKNCMFFISRENYEHFTSYGFFMLLKLVLLNNYFCLKEYKKVHYFLQINGIAMGTSCGPSVANLYLAFFELKFKYVLKDSLLVIYRFIDDIFYITNYYLDKDFFKIIYPGLTLNIETSKRVVFLDVIIFLNSLFGLNFDLYIKPTNTFSYLLCHSNHPSFICKNIPKSLIFRIRRICSELNDYYIYCSTLHNNLLKRCYNSNNIRNLIRHFAKVDRNDLIKYREKNSFKKDNSILFELTFDKKMLNIYNLIKDAWNLTLKDFPFFKNFLLNIYYKTQTNLGSYLLNNRKFNFSEKRFKTCDKKNCKVCLFSNSSCFLTNKYNIPIIIPSYTNCDSIDCIYILNCKKCNLQYVGKTNRSIKERLREHIDKITYAIKNKNNATRFQNFLKNNLESSLVYKHFSINHDLSDFEFQVFVSNCSYFILRLESDLICILNTLNPNGLNLSYIFNIRSLHNYKEKAT
jgi:hypothetical protein